MKSQKAKYQKLEEEIDSIKTILRRYNHLFVRDLINFEPQRARQYKDPDGNYHFLFYWPYQTSKTSSEGLKLTHDMGTITIEVEFVSQDLRNFKEVKHTFRYFNPYHYYGVIYNDGVGSGDQCFESDYYMFRFDKYLISPKAKKRIHEPLEHIQVLHALPRFPYEPKDHALTEFMKLVEATCYVEDEGALIGNKVPFFANAS